MGGNSVSGRLRAWGWRVTVALSVCAMLIAPGLSPTAQATVPLHFTSQATWLVSPGGMKALGDVNGDGKADLVLFGRAPDYRGIYVALSTGSSFSEPKRWGDSNCGQTGGAQICLLADVNGDKKADVVAFAWGDGKAEGSANVWVSLSSGGQFGPQALWNDGFCITEQVCALADVNGDHRADLVAFTPLTGLVWTSLSTGTAFGENAVWQKYFCTKGEFCAVGDINGDGRADIISFKPHAAQAVEHGNVLWAASSGSGFGAPQYAHGYFCVDDESCYVGDFNGDGRADGLTLKAHYNNPFEAMVSLSNGTRWINPNPMTWSTSVRGYTRPAYVADVNGDGKADLVTYESGDGTGNNRFLVALTSDQPDTTPPTPPPTPGVAVVNLFNCVPEHDENGGYRPLYYWTKDLTSGAVNSSGAEEDLYDGSGYCPAAGSRPYTVQLADQHVYQIVAVDPQGELCNGRNDPEQLGCIRQIVAFKGQAGGSTVNVTIPS